MSDLLQPEEMKNSCGKTMPVGTKTQILQTFKDFRDVNHVAEGQQTAFCLTQLATGKHSLSTFHFSVSILYFLKKWWVKKRRSANTYGHSTCSSRPFKIPQKGVKNYWGEGRYTIQLSSYKIPSDKTEQ